MMMIVPAEEGSDFSEDDMVFAFEDDNKEKNKSRNPDLEFRPVPAEAVSSSSTTFNRKSSNNHNESNGSSKRMNSHNHRNDDQKRRENKHVVCQRSQPLDDLRYAVMTGNLETVKNILLKGIMVDAILKSGWTALMFAASSARHEIVLFLLENKADPNYHKDMYTPLIAACASGKNDVDLHKCVCHLLKYGAQVNAHERHLTTPLMFAAREGHFLVVKELIEAGANLHAQDNKNQTALFLAARGGHGQIVHLLLNKGADPHIVDCYGQTAVDVATSNDHKEVAAVLERSASKLESVELTEEIHQPSLTKEAKDLIKSVQTSSVPREKRKYFDKQSELEMFLNGLELSNVVDLFREHQLTFTDLLIMDEEELEKIGISQLGIRKKILEALKETHKKQWQNSSVRNLRQLQFISCPDAVAMMANISKHLKYISSTVTFVRNQIQSQPRILELAQDTANVHDLIDELGDNLKNINDLNDEIRFFKLHLDKVQDNVKYVPADLIVETAQANNQSSKRTLVFWTIICTATIGGIMWKKQRTILHLSSLILSKLPFLRHN